MRKMDEIFNDIKAASEANDQDRLLELREEWEAYVAENPVDTTPKTRSEPMTTQSCREAIAKGWTSYPSDEITVVHSNGLSSSITLRLQNERDGSDCLFSVANIMDAWKWLETVSKIEGRCVWYEEQWGFDYSEGLSDIRKVPYVESVPYLSRFGDRRKAEARIKELETSRKAAAKAAGFQY